MRAIAIPLSARAPSDGGEPGGDADAIVATTGADVVTVYAMYARQEISAANAPLLHVDYLIDRQGYIRARWIGAPESPTARAAEVFDQADLLQRERLRAPSPTAHTH
jgi:hypothetical protein